MLHEPSWVSRKVAKKWGKKRAEHVSIGFVVAEDKDMILLAQTASLGDVDCADLIQILKGTVTHIMPLWDKHGKHKAK